MGFDYLNLVASGIVFFVYGISCIISVIFTLSLDTYRKIDEKLNLDVLSVRFISPLDLNINLLDDWLMRNNKIVGPLLIVLSTVDLKLLFNIIYTF
jgi:hypothetical protein